MNIAEREGAAFRHIEGAFQGGEVIGEESGKSIAGVEGVFGVGAGTGPGGSEGGVIPDAGDNILQRLSGAVVVQSFAGGNDGDAQTSGGVTECMLALGVGG